MLYYICITIGLSTYLGAWILLFTPTLSLQTLQDIIALIIMTLGITFSTYSWINKNILKG